MREVKRVNLVGSGYKITLCCKKCGATQVVEIVITERSEE